MTDIDAPATAREPAGLGSFIGMFLAGAGFLYALGLMIVPVSFDNGGKFHEALSCGMPVRFDEQAFAKRNFGSYDELDEYARFDMAGCAAEVAARQHKAVGALAVATPLGVLALYLDRRGGGARYR